MQLKDYIRSNGLTLDAFRTRIGGVARMTVSRYANGKRIPRPEIMARIVEATGGAVGPTDFYSPVPTQPTNPEAVHV